MTRMERIRMKYEEAKTKTKETAVKVKNKVSVFVSQHPRTVVGLVAVGTGLGVLIRYMGNNSDAAAVSSTQDENNYAGMVQKGLSEDGNEDTIDYIPAKNENDESEKDAFKKLWEENYKDNWDKVVSFADTLDMKSGEMFIIEDSKQYADEPWYDGKPIVSHLVDNCGMYPPDE